MPLSTNAEEFFLLMLDSRCGDCSNDLIFRKIIIGEGSGIAGSMDIPVEVSLENPADRIKGIQLDICDVDDYLIYTGCEITDRTVGFTCSTSEIDNGCCCVMLFSLTGSLIEIEKGFIFTLKYDVSNVAPQGECRNLIPENLIVYYEYNQFLELSSVSGEFCFFSRVES